ncbi:LPS export ABC transporter permease LptG [Candidatus Methylospira mobilis]|uniref:LPS export ABC transporter permease LptG n=1 Tax=Candidatus Methylospira mobilis TaxID=1808979 RepID=A0A5Q0BHC1_9GAMM|nr:LPS export ABC transporter permease LptG [Candidatus Methylospira mobilis]QFY42929.1 LPS export ABC transporter permease LptG [Candidatus Methylospira mobilis]WNV03833.1 LPS export ABC transporter permease LptG [Candidatus Methylospira mobilis]
MSVLDRYIGFEVIKGVFIAILVLLALLNFFTFTDELGEIGHGDYGFFEIFKYLALTTPRGFYDLLPSAALLGALSSLGALANNRELVAIQAAGGSKLGIVLAVIKAGVLLAIFTALVGEYVSPVSERAAQILRSSSLHEQVASLTKYGFWVRDGNIFINIRKTHQHVMLNDISIYEVESNKLLKRASHADKAVYDKGTWYLESIKSSYFGGPRVVIDRADSTRWDTIVAPDLLSLFAVKPEHLSAAELLKYMDYMEDNAQQSLSVELAFWERMVNPFVTIAMLLVAVPFVLSVGRDSTMGQRIVVGVVFGLGFYLFNRMVGHLGLVYEVNPVFTATLPTLTVLAGAIYGLLRLR